MHEISDNQAQKALDRYRNYFLKHVNVNDLLVSLHSRTIINSKQWIEIKNCPYEKSKVYLLFDILRYHRTSYEFAKFCLLLQENSRWIVQQFGKKLFNKAKLSTR